MFKFLNRRVSAFLAIGIVVVLIVVAICAFNKSCLNASLFSALINNTLPSVSVTSPNGGETWKKGSYQTIKWTSSNLQSADKIYVSVINASGNKTTTIASALSSTSKSYTWKIPSDSNLFPAGQYKVNVWTVKNQKTISDKSDNYFNIADDGQIGFKNILFIVDSNIAQNIKLELGLFKNQLNKEYGWAITQKEFSPNIDKKDIKEYVVNFYKTSGLKGIYLIGNIPTGEYVEGNYAFDSILGDYYYTDIYDQCKEVNLVVGWECYDPQINMNFTMQEPCEQHGRITIQEIKKALLSRELPCARPWDESPFFVSRITPNSSEENNSDLIKNYFTNNLDYRTGKMIFQHKALIYIPMSGGGGQDSAFRTSKTEELKNYLAGKYKNIQTQGAFTDVQINVIDSEQENSDDQFLQELKRNYEYFFYMGHGSPSSMQKNLTPEKVRETSSLLGDFFSCSVGRFTEKDYITGEFLFKGKMLFTNAASTPAARSTSFSIGYFNYLLTRGIPISEALAATGFRGYGSNMLGDVSLKLANKPSSRTPNDPEINVPQTIDFGEIPNNNGSSISFDIKNNGFSDLFIFNIDLVFKVKDKSHRVLGLAWDITSNSFKLSSQESRKLDLGIQPVVSSVGDYFGKIIVISNDPVYPIKEIPFVLKIK